MVPKAVISPIVVAPPLSSSTKLNRALVLRSSPSRYGVGVSRFCSISCLVGVFPPFVTPSIRKCVMHMLVTAWMFISPGETSFPLASITWSGFPLKCFPM